MTSEQQQRTEKRDDSAEIGEHYGCSTAGNQEADSDGVLFLLRRGLYVCACPSVSMCVCTDELSI